MSKDLATLLILGVGIALIVGAGMWLDRAEARLKGLDDE